VTNTSGGEVVLGASGGAGGGNWCTPNLSIPALDLPGQGIATAVSAIQGLAYTTSGGNSSGDSTDSIKISDPPYPALPVATNEGSYNNYKTYAIYLDGTYVYLTSDHPGLTVDIVRVSNFQEVGFFNPTGGGTGKSVYVTGGIGYVTVGNKLYTFDMSSVNGVSSQQQLGSITLAGTGTKVIVVGSYAYVAIAGSIIELQVVQVGNGGRNLTVVAQGDVNGQAAQDVFVNTTGTRAYLITNVSSTQNEFFIVDTSLKSGNLPIVGSYNTTGMNPKGLAIVPGNRAIVVGSGGEQYQVVDITNETNPVHCGGINAPYGATSINAISSVLESDGDAFSYILTNDSSHEFQIIAGTQNASSGVFESSTFDAGASVTFNFFVANAVLPAKTNIQYQVSGADPNLSTGNCNGTTFTYIGPDGTSNTQFATGSAIPIQATGSSYKNPARCFRYKVFLSTSEILNSPVFTDITVNYSP